MAANGQGQCQLFESKGAAEDAAADATQSAASQQDLEEIMKNMEDQTDISVDTLRSLYVSLLSGLVVDEEDDTTQVDIELLVEDTLMAIDANGDGKIDMLEIEGMQLPREAGEFLFEDVVECTAPTTSANGETCVTPDNVITLLNEFYAGSEVVGADLAQKIVEQSGPNACFTHAEFESAFSDAETLSAGYATMPDLSFVLSAAFGVGTAFFVSGLALPF